jgi:predicted small lipoprotein YifL
MLPLPSLPNARLALLLMLVLLAVSLTACGTCSPKPLAPVTVEAPRIPAAPPMTEPAPSEGYSLSAQQRIKTWRERLTAIFGTP